MSSSSSSRSGSHEGLAVLVVGADGLIGAAVSNELSSLGAAVTRTTRRSDGEGVRWDLAREGLPREIAGRDFDLVVIAAAVTTLAACESDPDLSRVVNVERPTEISRRWSKADTRVIGLSTSLVFDGESPFPEPADDPRPTNEYGRQKVAMEASMLDEGANVAILRMAKVIGRNWSRLTEWRSTLSSGANVAAFTDTGFSPIALSDVVSSVALLASRVGSEILHLSARDEISYFEFAESIRAKDRLPGRVDPALAHGSPAFRRFATLGTATQKVTLPGTELHAEVVVRSLLQ